MYVCMYVCTYWTGMFICVFFYVGKCVLMYVRKCAYTCMHACISQVSFEQ